MVISFPSSPLKSLARPDLDDVDGGRLGARNLVGDILAFDVRLVPQRQHDRPDHGDQQHDTSRLEEIDIARVEHVPQRFGIEHAGDRRNWRRDRTLHVGTDRPADSTSTSSIRRMPPRKAPIGRYCMNPCRSWAKSTSSIITTNRNSTKTAPT